MSATTAKENEALVNRVVQKVWNEGNLDLINELYAEKFVGHVLGEDDLLLGPEGYKEWVNRIRTEFPDLAVSLDDLFPGDEVVCGQWTLTGTNEGELTFVGIPSTGKPVEYSGLFIARIKDGRIVEEWNVADSYTALQQLGLVPAPTAE